MSSTLISCALVYAAGKDIIAKNVALHSLMWSSIGGWVNFISPLFILQSLENYKKTDLLVDYVDPTIKGKGHIEYLKHIAPHDSLPMFRLLGGDSSITFTDPYSGVTDWVGLVIPEAFIMGFSNLFSQLFAEGDIGLTNRFAMASKAATLGVLAHVSARDQGTALVSKSSGWATGTKSLTDPMVDVKRARFNAAPQNDEERWRTFAMATEGVVIACLAIDVALSWFPALAEVANIAAMYGSKIMLLNMMTSLLTDEDLITEVSDSHMLPLKKKYLETWFAKETNSFTPIKSGSSSYTPYLMKDFLYERPFVNLALSDLHTLDSLQKNSDESDDFRGLVTLLKNASSAKKASVRDSVLNAASSLKTYRQQIEEMLSDSCMNINSCLDSRLSSFVSARVASLNRNCYYIGSRDSVNCATGLFAKQDSLNSTLWMQGVSALTPLKFHSESDWSKMGVKVDRWEKVDGLNPDGSDNPGGVPIRHVERYEVPAITVEDWINKYSFVVDDLMPHRLRQIRMNFNFVTEIAWECDITKAEDDDKACKVYQRSAGEPWGEPKKTVRHPVKKNGLFDFNPRDYGYDNLFAIQKDNQNTVTISMVNKIGLSNTQ